MDLRDVHNQGNRKEPVRIALIDDMEDLRISIAALLESKGYVVDEYGSARVALAEMRERKRPDVIMFDLRMPDMDGWSFRIAQRECPILRDIPAIAISASTSAEAAAIDADAYVQKPLELDRMGRLIEEVLAASRRKHLLVADVEADRLRSLGLIVASVAHEVNNPLQAIVGQLDVCERLYQQARTGEQVEGELGERIHASLSEARHATDRISSIVRLLLTFARRDNEAEETGDAVRAIDAAISLAQSEVRRSARIERDVEVLPRVAISEARLAQVLLSLLVNAAQSLDGSTSADPIVRVIAKSHRDRVRIEVVDSGRGIAPELQGRVFDPLFSTKAGGKGVGLSLSIAREIVQSAGGKISARSQVGRGSVFTVELPSAQPDIKIANRSAVSGVTSRLPESRLRILIVDDEALVCRMLATLLDQHDVTTFVDAERALMDIGDQHFDLVLSDWMMPRMTGHQFYRALIRQRPDLKAAFTLMTGAAPSEELDAFIAELQNPVLRKPFRNADLEIRVRELAHRSSQALAPATRTTARHA
jgi:signal transduction histidine kinase